MKIVAVLCLAVLAVSMVQARVTNKELLKMARPADDNIKADHNIELTGDLDDEVDFQDILKKMGYDFHFEDSKDEAGDAHIIEDGMGFKNVNKADAELKENVEAGECSCYGTTCVCCNVLAITYNGQICLKVYHSGSYFYIYLYWNGALKYSSIITSPKLVVYTYASYLKGYAHIYYVSGSKLCLQLYFYFNGKYYYCAKNCLTLTSSGLQLQ